MTARLSEILLKTVLMAGALCCAVLLLRDGLAIPLHVPLDPNEGWNAYHADAAMRGAPLYPQGLMVNNYPPLSFYIVGLVGRPLGDMILAGRLLSLASFVGIAMGLAALVRQIGGTVLEGIFASLVFAGALLIASDYVAMDDPQLLAHAIQIQALLLLWRERPLVFLSAALFALSLFVKQNLVALPLAALAWLAWHRRRDAGLFAACGIALGLAGLLLVRLGLGSDLLAALGAPRMWRLANLAAALKSYFAWAALPLLLAAWAAWRGRADPAMRFCALYAAIALAVGIGFSAGDGVDANIFFDLDIALALSAGLALSRLPPAMPGFFALGFAAPLALFLARNFPDNNFPYTEAFQRQAAPDIAFIAGGRGAAMCEMPSLCYWARKPASVDVFNISQQFQTGARRDGALAAMVDRREFATIQLASMTDFALGPRVKQAMRRAYRVDHIDDNGVFLLPRQSNSRLP